MHLPILPKPPIQLYFRVSYPLISFELFEISIRVRMPLIAEPRPIEQTLIRKSNKSYLKPVA